MGTNFYLRTELVKVDDCDDPKAHIGKRSGAGYYCWDCKETLTVGGEKNIHTGRSKYYPSCPSCDKLPKKESVEESSVGRELGFNKSKPRKKSGVASAASFTWAMTPLSLVRLCVDYRPRSKPIEDEYGRTYTLVQFLEVMDECPIQLFDFIGRWFS